MASGFTVRPATLGVAALKLMVLMGGASLALTVALVGAIAWAGDHRDHGIGAGTAEPLVQRFLEQRWGVPRGVEADTWFDGWDVRCVKVSRLVFSCRSPYVAHATAGTDTWSGWTASDFLCDAGSCALVQGPDGQVDLSEGRS